MCREYGKTVPNEDNVSEWVREARWESRRRWKTHLLRMNGKRGGGRVPNAFCHWPSLFTQPRRMYFLHAVGIPPPRQQWGCEVWIYDTWSRLDSDDNTVRAHTAQTSYPWHSEFLEMKHLECDRGTLEFSLFSPPFCSLRVRVSLQWNHRLLPVMSGFRAFRGYARRCKLVYRWI